MPSLRDNYVFMQQSFIDMAECCLKSMLRCMLHTLLDTCRLMLSDIIYMKHSRCRRRQYSFLFLYEMAYRAFGRKTYVAASPLSSRMRRRRPAAPHNSFNYFQGSIFDMRKSFSLYLLAKAAQHSSPSLVDYMMRDWHDAFRHESYGRPYFRHFADSEEAFSKCAPPHFSRLELIIPLAHWPIISVP